jgi:hypothetical protein
MNKTAGNQRLRTHDLPPLADPPDWLDSDSETLPANNTRACADRNRRAVMNSVK